MVVGIGSLRRSLSGYCKSGSKMTKFRNIIGRLGNLAGPIVFAFSGFLAALVVQRTCSTHEFGIFAFIQVILATGMALTNGLISVPALAEVARNRDRMSVAKVFLPVGVLYCLIGALLTLPVAIFAGASPEIAVTSVILAFVTWTRYLYRALALMLLERKGATRSDVLYGIAYSLCLGVCYWLGSVTLISVLILQILSSLVAVITVARPVGGITASRLSAFNEYALSFRAVGFGAAIVAVCGQVSSSAHAYITTLWLSPSAFAPLALATLVYRPLGVVLTGIMQFESPRLANLFSSDDEQRNDHGVKKVLNEIYSILSISWVANSIIAGCVAVYATSILGNRQYSIPDVRVALVLVGVLVLLRAAREPQTALLGVAGASNQLARISIVCSVVTLSIVAGFAWLFSASPALTLVGPVIGEAINLMAVLHLANRYQNRTSLYVRESND